MTTTTISSSTTIHTTSPPLPLTPTHHFPTTVRPHPHPYPNLRLHLRHTTTCSYKISIQHEGQTTQLEVDPDETILEKALESGMSVPHDCKLGVCMTCPAKLLAGSVDQSEGMLSDDVIERGYSLLCVSYPKSDCEIKIIPEEELLSLQLATADD
ncbi:putative 2Fe-2S ferredoxin-type iron-sulfur binding domain, ferredoxin [2Fe-2S], plant [Helianthus anomalus]